MLGPIFDFVHKFLTERFDESKELVGGIGDKKFKGLKGKLQLNIKMSEYLIPAVLFLTLLKQRLDFAKYFGGVDFSGTVYFTVDFWKRVFAFTNDKGFAVLLSIFTYFWFLRYRKTVNDELEILESTFSKLNMPENWAGVVGKNSVALLTLGITGAFIALASFSTNIKIYCVILILLNLQDMHGNSVLRKNIIILFANDDLVPFDTEPYKRTILLRRKMAEEYWIDRPQLERIGLVIIANVAALLLSVSKPVFGFNTWIGFPNIIVLSAIIANEWTMTVWRRVRDKKIHSIEQEEEVINKEQEAINKIKRNDENNKSSDSNP